MKLLHNIGKKLNRNYNTPDQVAICHDAMSFDGVYHNVYQYRELLRDKNALLFVMGNYVGLDNSFDKGMPLERMCSWKELYELRDEYGCEIGWHTWSHPDLTLLTRTQLEDEIQPPFPMDSFAYPYGRFSDDIIEVVKQFGFKRAYTVHQGDDSDYQLNREYLL